MKIQFFATEVTEHTEKNRFWLQAFSATVSSSARNDHAKTSVHSVANNNIS